jgi:hydrogenase maturation protease
LKPKLILCLGNEIVSDDGFGPALASLLAKEGEITDRADVLSAALAGFSLLDLLAGRSEVLVVDCQRTGRHPPGTLHRFDASELVPTRNLAGSHQISLPTALELGRRLGYAMPARVEVLCVEATDLETLSETLTPAVAAALPSAREKVHDWALTR